MQFIKNIFYRIINKEPIKLLGRWNIQYCSNMKKNIDWSNNDHSLCFITPNLR